MSVYMLIEIEVRDPTVYAEYMSKVPEVVKKYGGRYLVRGGTITPLTGDWKPERVILLEFDSTEQMRTWNQSLEYKALAPLRIASAATRAIGLEGFREDLPGAVIKRANG